jgi:acyl-CoA oxidase
MDSLLSSGADRAARRAAILAGHLIQPELAAASILSTSNCLHYNAPELTNPASFNTIHLRRILDGHHVEARDWLFKLMEESPLFCAKRRCEGKVFVAPDYNTTKEQQREMTMRRIEFLLNNGVFEGWLTDPSTEVTMRKFALMECLGIFDHSLTIKIGVHFMLWLFSANFNNIHSLHLAYRVTLFLNFAFFLLCVN